MEKQKKPLAEELYPEWYTERKINWSNKQWKLFYLLCDIGYDRKMSYMLTDQAKNKDINESLRIHKKIKNGTQDT